MRKDSGLGHDGFTRSDYFKVTFLSLGLSAFWGSLSAIVLPVRLLDFVPAAQKTSYLGYLTFAGLMIAMVYQPIIGAISDRSSFSWGRRRPFILAGILLAVFLIPGIGLWENIVSIAVVYCLLQIACNTAQASYQGFIPDLVPESKRGSASGIKTMLEFAGAFILARPVALFIDRYSSGKDILWLWIALGTLAAFLLVPMIVTVITVKEKAWITSALEPRTTGLFNSFHIDLGQNHDFIWFLLSRGLMSIPGLTLQTYILYYIMDVFKPSNPAGVTANLLIVVGVSLVITAYFAGRISDRMGRKPVLIYSGFVGALGILFLFLSRNPMQLMLSGVVFGIANGAFWSTSWAQATDMLPKRESARYMGLVNLASTAGGGLARLNGPMITAFNAFGHNLGYSAMLLISASCFIAGSLLMLKVNVVRRERSDTPS